MEIVLVYNNKELGSAWKEDFQNQENVKILEGDITKVDCDAIVSPANSFGFMDGELDQALINFFGSDLEDALKNKIEKLKMRELLVGQSLLLKTGNNNIPYLISSPTMRVPMNFNIESSVNAYLAMKSSLLLIQDNPLIRKVAIPGLCVGTGGMDVNIASKQMHLAYEEVINDEVKDYRSVNDLHKYQYRLNEQGKIWINGK